jgi:DNA primase
MSRLNITTTTDEILQSTNGGKDIFERELGKIGKKCISSPLRNDKNPSFSIFFSNNGLWMYKDFSNDDAGTAIQFIQKRYKLSFKEALEYVQKENNINFNITTTYTKPKPKEKLIVDWVEMPFSDRHKQYFDQYELDETFLNSRDIYALKTIAINKEIIQIPENQYKFAYYAKDIDQIKVLTLGENVSKHLYAVILVEILIVGRLSRLFL